VQSFCDTEYWAAAGRVAAVAIRRLAAPTSPPRPAWKRDSTRRARIAGEPGADQYEALQWSMASIMWMCAANAARREIAFDRRNER